MSQVEDDDDGKSLTTQESSTSRWWCFNLSGLPSESLLPSFPITASRRYISNQLEQSRHIWGYQTHVTLFRKGWKADWIHNHQSQLHQYFCHSRCSSVAWTVLNWLNRFRSRYGKQGLWEELFLWQSTKSCWNSRKQCNFSLIQFCRNKNVGIHLWSAPFQKENLNIFMM